MIRCRRITVTTDYQLYGKLTRTAENSGYKMDPPVFDENVSFSLIIPEAEAESYAAYMRDFSNAKATVEVAEESEYLMK